MRFWLTRNREVSIREQLVSQVVLGVLSQDLPPGAKLPSVRALARRHRIHANTVSAAYHELLEHGWLELRRGSGLYVRSLSPDASSSLDDELLALLRGAKSRGTDPEQVLRRLESLLKQICGDRV